MTRSLTESHWLILSDTTWSSRYARFLWWEPLWLAVLSGFILLPGHFVPSQFYPLLVLLLAGFWPLRWLITQRLWQPTPLNLSIAVLLLWLPVNLWASADRARSWPAVGCLCLGIAWYFALIHWPPSSLHPERIAWFLLVCGAGLLLLGPLLTPRMALDLAVLAGIQGRLKPLTEQLGETINPNILAGGIALLTPLAAALTLRWDWTSRRWLPFLLGLLSCCGIVLIILAQSRGADIGTILAILIIFVLRWPKLTYATPLLLLLLVAGLYWLGPNFLFPKLTNDSALGGLEGRLEIWSRAVYAIQDFPFTGIGIGTFGEVIPLLYPYFVIAPDVAVPHAHNLFLQVAVDLGIPGLVAYLALLINLFRMVYHILTNRQSALSWALGAGSLGALLAMLLHGMVDATLWGSKLAVLPWLLFAMITRLYLARFTKVMSPKATAEV